MTMKRRRGLAAELPALQATCDRWNESVPVGRPVDLTKDDDTVMRTRTRSKAEVLSGHSAVIWLEGVRGCYDLDRVKPVEVLYCARCGYATTHTEAKYRRFNTNMSACCNENLIERPPQNRVPPNVP